MTLRFEVVSERTKGQVCDSIGISIFLDDQLKIDFYELNIYPEDNLIVCEGLHRQFERTIGPINFDDLKELVVSAIYRTN